MVSAVQRAPFAVAQPIGVKLQALLTLQATPAIPIPTLPLVAIIQPIASALHLPHKVNTVVVKWVSN